MGRGRCYTKEENKALMELRKMFPDDNMRDLAKKAVALNTCPGKSVNAIHEHYKKMLNPKPKKIDPDPVQITMYEHHITTSPAVLTRTPTVPEANKISTEVNVGNVYRDLYKDLVSTIFDNAKLFEGEYGDLFIDLPALRRWLKRNESDRYWGRVDELREAAKYDK